MKKQKPFDPTDWSFEDPDYPEDATSFPWGLLILLILIAGWWLLRFC